MSQEYEYELSKEVTEFIVKLATQTASEIAVENYIKKVNEEKEKAKEKKIKEVKTFSENYRTSKQGIYKKMRNYISSQNSSDYTFETYMRMMESKPFEWHFDRDENYGKSVSENILAMVIFENAFRGLRDYYELIGDEEGKQRMRVYYQTYIDDEKVPMKKICETEQRDIRSLYRDLDRTMEEIALAMMLI